MKRWMPRILAVVIGFVIGVLLARCGLVASAEQTRPLKLWGQNESGMYQTAYVIDELTGVQYVVVSAYVSYHEGLSVAITPRLNADGGLYTTK